MPTGPVRTVFFLSDFGTQDEFAGVVHAVIAARAPGTTVIDLTHNIPAFDVRAGSHTLVRAVPHLGPGVVLGVVDPGVGTGRRGIGIEVALPAGGTLHFIGPDNGLLVASAEEAGEAPIRRVVELHRPPPPPDRGSTFDGRDLFGPAAAALCAGGALLELGDVVDPHSLVRLIGGVVEEGRLPDGRTCLRAEVTWADHYGNLQLAATVADARVAGLPSGDCIELSAPGASGWERSRRPVLFVGARGRAVAVHRRLRRARARGIRPAGGRQRAFGRGGRRGLGRPLAERGRRGAGRPGLVAPVWCPRDPPRYPLGGECGFPPEESKPAAAPSRRIPEATVLRLPVYQRILAELERAGASTVSSEQLATLARVNAAKVRKDLSLLGSFGTRGSGYEPGFLIAQIDRALGVDANWSVAIVGIGNLGRALTNSAGFASRGCQITSLFDVDPDVVGEEIRGMTVRHMDEIASLRAAERPDIGVIATPGPPAQQVADLLIRAGVTSLLNFAPRVLNVPADRPGALRRPLH